MACRRRGPGCAALALQRMAGLSTARQHHAMFACCALQQALQHVAYLSAVRCSYMSDLGLLSTARGRVSLRDVAMVPLPPTCAAWSGIMLLWDYYATVDTMLPVGYYQLPSARESARWQPQCGPPGLTLRRWRLWTTRCGTSPGSPARRRWQACVAFVAPAHRASDLRPLAAPKRPRGNRLMHASFCCLRVLRSCGLN